MSIRQASHAGSWYDNDANKLMKYLQTELSETQRSAGHTKALIVPHAAYDYCGTTAAWAWKNVDPSKVKRVFVLGPSHFKFLERCAFPRPSVVAYNTPLGDVHLDQTVMNEMRRSYPEYFVELSPEEDTSEHSVEMMLPFLKAVMGPNQFTLIPVVVGALSPQTEHAYAQVFFKHFSDPESLFVISSDFCHWGRRFRYTYIRPDSRDLTVNEAIHQLDTLAVNMIERHDVNTFYTYLRVQGNTICGRHAIGILLQLIQTALAAAPKSLKTTRVHYSQSSEIRSPDDSCVAYCAMVTEVVTL